MSDNDCGCCAGIGVEAPDGLDNPPGQDALSYRVGTHGRFFRTMMARLGVLQAEQGLGGSAAASRGGAGCLGESHRSFLLGGDPEAASALLDGWACIADVLTFYQERIANEGFLRTATEERSVIELGRLTGYEPRPGVSASVHLAFAVQEGFDGEIPARTRTQSMPRQGQTAQMFETSQPLLARAEWNAMAAARRATGRYIRREYYALRKKDVPKDLPSDRSTVDVTPTRRIEIFLEGVGQNVQAGDVVLVSAQTKEAPRADDVYRVTNVWPHPESGYTTLRLVPLDGKWHRGGAWDVAGEDLDDLDPLAVPTLRVASANVARARRSVAGLAGGADDVAGDIGDMSLETVLALLSPGPPELREHVLSLMRALEPEPAPAVQVMRARAQIFGHASPPVQRIKVISEEESDSTTSESEAREHDAASDERKDVVYLAGELAAMKADTTLVMRAPESDDATSAFVTLVFTVKEVEVQSRLAYGTPGKTTRAVLDGSWWEPIRDEEPRDITPIRRTVVYAQPEPLVVVGEALQRPVDGSTIDLDRAVAELPADRLVIVEGERDLPGVSGVRVAELASIASSTLRFANDPVPVRLQMPAIGGTKGGVIELAPLDEVAGRSRGHTRLTLAAPLRYRYRRSTVVVRGNVAHATHGETRDEILGSGDAAVPQQRFTLRQGPRTWESAATPTGIASTLIMRVSGVLWPEVPSHALPGPRDEVVRTRTLSDRKDELRGGDGRRGARFPTGIENLTARYRVGLGAAGNVDAGLINALVTRPIGVREVINPLRSSGGADPDGRDEIRMRIPIAARSIDRLVSVSDHADFALNFAGVDKATAAHLGSGIEVVIAGDEDVAIDEGSDLLRNLRAAFQLYGDPMLRPVVRVATPVPLMLQAAIRIDPLHEWSRVEPALRERLLLRHGWDVRDIGDAAHLSTVLEALQSVDGVRSVDVDVFGPLRPDTAPPPPSTPPSGTSESQAIKRRLAERQLGALERLQEGRSGHRRWTFAASSSEILYFARTAPTLIAFTEVVS